MDILVNLQRPHATSLIARKMLAHTTAHKIMAGGENEGQARYRRIKKKDERG
jgi:hypothetical protein